MRLKTSVTARADFVERNLQALAAHQPAFATRVARAAREARIQVVASRSGHPVPVIAGSALHGLDDPLRDAQAHPDRVLRDPGRERLLFYGFGFGYDVAAFVERGLGASVYEPFPECFAAALAHVDLTPLLPFVKLYFEDHLPDLPRSTNLVVQPTTARLAPGPLARLRAALITHEPPPTRDLTEGIYYSTYRNVTCLKNPLDLAVYQMLIFQIRPTVVIEVGACRGGSTLFFADLLALLGGDRRVLSYDVTDEIASEVREHPLIQFSPKGHAAFDPALLRPQDRVLVIEDSAHSYANTLEVLERFAPVVTPGSYLVVEDTLAGLTRPHLEGGPRRAVEEFLGTRDDFEVDGHWERFYGDETSNCRRGFLRRRWTAATGDVRDAHV